jgi:uncharacterized protein (TIGR04141 family)
VSRRRLDPTEEWPTVAFHLAREDVENLHDLLARPSEMQELPLRPDSEIDGVLFLAPPSDDEPAWTKPLGLIAELPEIRTRGAGAVLIFRAANRIFAASFGRGTIYLRRDRLVSDFGLRAAANRVDPLRVASVDSRAIEKTVFTNRRQASQGAAVGEMGFEGSRELLQGLTGRARDPDFAKRITGSESLHLSKALRAEELPEVAEELLKAYADDAYKGPFGNIDRMRQVTGPMATELDARLVSVLNLPDRGQAYLATPEIVDWSNVAGFRFNGDERGIRRQDLTLEDYARLRGPITIESLTADSVSLIARDTDRAAVRWSVYRCLIWEHTDGGQHLVLSDGHWWIVDPGYVEQVDRIVGSMVETSVELIPFQTGTDVDEATYNIRCAANLTGSRATDKKLAAIAGERGQVELCDILGPGPRLIHIKRGLRSQNMSYLFDQAVGSAEALRHLPDVRRRLLELSDALPEIPDLIDVEAGLRWGEWEVVLAVITTSPERVPSLLPFLGRAHLARTITALDRLGFRVTYFGVPVT